MRFLSLAFCAKMQGKGDRIMQLFHSLKIKLIVICTSISLVLALLLSLQINKTMKANLEREQQQTIDYNLHLISSNLERELDVLYQLIVFCSTNKEVVRFTSGASRSSYSSYPVSMTAYEALNAKIFNSSIDKYIRKLILCSKNGDVIIQGQTSGMLQDKDVCIGLPYFDELFGASTYEWIGLLQEPFYYSNPSARSLPIVRPIVNRDSGTIDGWIYIALDPCIVEDKLINTRQTFDSTYYWLVGDKAYRLEGGSFCETSFDLEQAPGERRLGTLTEKGGKATDVMWITTDNAPWTILQTIPESGNLLRGRNFKLLLPYFAMVVIVFLFTDYLLIRMVSTPITRIRQQLELISSGVFTINPALETPDEFGDIGRGINSMSQSISRLMQQQLEHEHEKQQLELINLQNQISPHFLYNTLYTIKWMAILQNAPGISEMLDSLGQIMKYISKNTDSKISLEDELKLLGHYITIQRYRYGDSFTYTQSIADPSLLSCRVFKFSLQPLIENAITHGINGKQQPGQIQLRVTREGEDLLIDITDNGVGISQQQIDEILTYDKDITEELLFKKIGLKNIDRRLKLEYGDRYGIQIHSRLGSYTEVLVRYPYLP